MRGFFYFYLVNLYGEVPLIVSTDYKLNANLAKSKIEVVFQHIISDLQQAKQLLDDRYVDATILRETSNRVRPNRMAATASVIESFLFFIKSIQRQKPKQRKLLTTQSCIRS